MPDELDLRSRQQRLGPAERRNWRGTETGPRSAATGGGSCAFSRVSTKICRCRGNRENAGPWTKGGEPMARAVLTTLIFLADAVAHGRGDGPGDDADGDAGGRAGRRRDPERA